MRIIAKIRATVCAWLNHSCFITSCFGYIYCARCGEQVGDSLMSIAPSGVRDPRCNCDACQGPYRSHGTWRDKLLLSRDYKASWRLTR